MNTASIPVHSTWRAFTLIELLTVIAIIGILAAIIIPTVGRVRETAKSANCTSNLRQINMALKLYVEDNKGYMPPANIAASRVPGYTGNGNAVNWAKGLARYLPQEGRANTSAPEHAVFTCPSAEFQGKQGKDLSNTYMASAALLGLNSTGTAATDDQVGRSINSIDNTSISRIPLIMEGKANGQLVSTFPSSNWSAAQTDAGRASYERTTRFDFRHKGSMNVSYVDGSVRRLDFAAFKVFALDATSNQLLYQGLRPR